MRDPYEELPYLSFPVEWAAPERLALASWLHGGPRPDSARYRMLELGCARGANLLPLAYYRRGASFTGVDQAASQCATARRWAAELGLSNFAVVEADFEHADAHLDGRFDYVFAHGVFSWVPDRTRDGLLAICERRLAARGLLCISYNARPGWDVRGMVRDFLLAQTAGHGSLAVRARLCQELSRRVAVHLATGAHPFSQLLAREFRRVHDHDVSYVAHEYLAEHNRAYWRGEFLELLARRGFELVTDADFNYASGRVPESARDDIRALGIDDAAIDATVDLLSYRQLHCPLLGRAPVGRTLPANDELAQVFLASCLAPAEANGERFVHPSGGEVEIHGERMRRVLAQLQERWPRGLPIGELFGSVDEVRDDLLFLQRGGFVELRLVEPESWAIDGAPLNRLEAEGFGYRTTAYHTTSSV